MPRKIDLLPSELRADTKVVGYARTFRLVAISVVVFSFFVFLGGVLALYLRNNNLRELAGEREGLENDVRNLEATEQQLVLVRDRIKKIQEVLDSRDNEKVIARHAQLVSTFQGGLAFDSAEVEASGSRLGIVSTSSREMSNLFNRLAADKTFGTVVIEDLEFNPVLGYEFYLNMY